MPVSQLSITCGSSVLTGGKKEIVFSLRTVSSGKAIQFEGGGRGTVLPRSLIVTLGTEIGKWLWRIEATVALFNVTTATRPKQTTTHQI